jgi:hypothetical protein
MKKYKAEAPKKNIKFNTNKQPDIRDNLDSRKNEEQDFKGNNVTHNLKDKQNRSNKHKH